MKKNKEIFSLNRIGLKSRLCIAFLFATFVPIVLIFYYVINSYKISILAVYVIVSVILMGWWFVFEVFLSITKIHNKTKETLLKIEEQGRIKSTGAKNEIESLSVVFSILSSKVKESVDELRKVNSKIEELNEAIDQKVKVLSSILDTDALFSKNASYTEIFQFLTERLKEITQAKTVISFFKEEGENGYIKFYSGVNERSASALLNSGDINSLMRIKQTEIVDSNHENRDFSFIRGTLDITNFIINPVFLKGKALGVIIAGNSIDGFIFPDDTGDIFTLFSYNMSIIWERRRLYRKVEDLKIKDPLTGLYNESFFINRLDEEIKRSTVYQRPCGFIAIEIVNYREYKQKIDPVELGSLLKKFVRIFRENLRPIDIIGIIRENIFGVIVIERNKRQSNYVAARLKESVYNFMEEVFPFAPIINVVVAESPIDGVDALKLFECVHQHLKTNDI